MSSIPQSEASQQGVLEASARVSASAYPALEDQIVCCTDKWAVRHCFVNEKTGEVVPVLCHTYGCKRCGPLRVEAWRSLIELAEPERFITLTRVGKMLAAVGRVTTVVVRRLRRLGYKFEYMATFEPHKNGYYHIHLLQKGDYIPQKVLSDCLASATHGYSYVASIMRCRPGTAGYVTKYCTKVLTAQQIGERSDGTRVRVNRVRYSKHFFPSPTKVLKAEFRAAAAEKKGEVPAADNFVTCDRCQGTGEYAGVKCVKCKGEGVCSAWKLLEVAPLPRDTSGRVIEEAAHEQYKRLVADRVKEVSEEPLKLSKGGKNVLAYMVLESLRFGEVATV